MERRLPKSLREQLAESVYPGVLLRVDMTRRKQLVLEIQETRTRLPVYSWTAGQRELTPFLMALYWLLPLGRYPKRGYEWVVIEEPEMGLHPRAIVGVIQALLHLLHRGYRVVLTTHSITVVEWVWLVQRLKSVPWESGQEALSEYLGIPRVPARLTEIAAEGLKKEIRTYYFRRRGTEVTAVDISSLDAWDENPDVAEWGGLATTTERAHRVLAQALSARSSG
ncbi:MAG: AAA family ATPase [Anaerolineae bacterium]